jgi:hypothetical protein
MVSYAYDMDTAPEAPEPNKRKILLGGLWIAGMIVTAGVLVFGSRAVASWYLNRTSTSGEISCPRRGTSHIVAIQGGVAEPATTYGVLCDTLTIINKDPKLRLIAFGPHDHHQAYDGITEEELAESQSVTVTFDKVGTFTFHDHIDDSSIGTFIVASH